MRIAVVPGVPALLASNASLDDPVAELRAACAAAVAWLVEDGPARVLAEPGARRLAEELLAHAGAGMTGEAGAPLLVVANGSAMRTEKAPGYFDQRAEAFDDSLRAALLTGDSAALAAVDGELAAELWAEVGPLGALGESVDLSGADIQVDFDGAPYGVQYWVLRFVS